MIIRICCFIRFGRSIFNQCTQYSFFSYERHDLFISIMCHDRLVIESMRKGPCGRSANRISHENECKIFHSARGIKTMGTTFPEIFKSLILFRLVPASRFAPNEDGNHLKSVLASMKQRIGTSCIGSQGVYWHGKRFQFQ